MGRGKTYDTYAVAQYAAEHGVKAASAHFDCSTDTVYAAGYTLNIPPRPARDIKAVEVVEWMKENNADVSAAATKFRRTNGTIQSYCDMLGHVPPPNPRAKWAAPLSNFEILAALIKGVPRSELTEKHRVSAQRISQIAINATKAGLLGPNACVTPCTRKCTTTAAERQ